MTFSEQAIKTEVLIIGSGIAGSFAAIRARELGAEVLVVEQGEARLCRTLLHRHEYQPRRPSRGRPR